MRQTENPATGAVPSEQRTIFSNGIPIARVGAMSLRHADLRSLESELDGLVVRWDKALAEFAEIKAKVRRG